jgi:riboflavin synthase
VFTGIVRELGTVVALDGGDDGARLVVDAPETAAATAVGDSVAIDGCCLTAVTVDAGRIAFDAVPETLSRTGLGALVAGDRVNVEPALRVGDPLGGHYVQGHVDTVGTVTSVVEEGDGRRISIAAPDGTLRYIAEKGSIAVDGTSLTVAAVDDETFAVALIPHTLEATTLGDLRVGTRVNLEFDVLAKYVERLLAR